MLNSDIMGAVCHTYLQGQHFIFGISLIGLLLSVSGIFSIVPSQFALLKLTNLFKDQNKSGKAKYQYLTKYGITLPGITGAGESWVAIFGSLSTLVVPFILMSSWIISLIFFWRFSAKPMRLICGHDFWNELKFIGTFIGFKN